MFVDFGCRTRWRDRLTLSTLKISHATKCRIVNQASIIDNAKSKADGALKKDTYFR